MLLAVLASAALAACLPSPPTPTPGPQLPPRPVGEVPKSVIEAAPTPPSGPDVGTPAAPGLSGGYPVPGPAGTPRPAPSAPAYAAPGQ